MDWSRKFFKSTWRFVQWRPCLSHGHDARLFCVMVLDIYGHQIVLDVHEELCALTSA